MTTTLKHTAAVLISIAAAAAVDALVNGNERVQANKRRLRKIKSKVKKKLKVAKRKRNETPRKAE
jgi:hypothetical protein